MNTAALQAFASSLNGQFVVLVGTALLVIGLINEVLDRNHHALLWVIRIVIIFGVVAGAAAEAAAWFV